MTAYYTPNDSFPANDASFYDNKVGYTLQVAVSFQLIVYGIITIIKWGTSVILNEFAVKQPKKEHKQGEQCSVK